MKENKEKTNSIFKRMITLITFTIICSAIAGCKPTPDEAIIFGNDPAEFQEMIMIKNEGSQIYDYPEDYYDEFLSKDGNVTITIDAEIITPVVDKLPVIKITPSPISNEMIQWAAEEFTEGEQGYYPTVFMNRGEAEALKIMLLGELADKDKIYEEYSSAQMADYIIDSYTKTIDFLNECCINTTEERIKIPATLALRPYGFYVHNDANLIETELNMTELELQERSEEEVNLYLQYDVQLSNGKYVRLGIYNEHPYDVVTNNSEGMSGLERSQIHVVTSNISMNLHPTNILESRPFNIGFDFGSIDTFYPELTKTIEESTNVAINRLEELGISDFYVESSSEEVGKYILSLYWNASRYGGLEDVDFEEYCEDIGAEVKFHYITFKPYYYGVPLLEANQAFFNDDMYHSSMEYEVITMRVAEDCIAEIKWTNPTDISNVLNDNVKIISLDTAIKNATEFMTLTYNLSTIFTYNPEGFDTDKITANINIDTIKLGLAGIPAYNSADEYLLIPVWNFYGSYSVDSKVEGNITEVDYVRVPLISVNAIDGSIIHQDSCISD